MSITWLACCPSYSKASLSPGPGKSHRAQRICTPSAKPRSCATYRRRWTAAREAARRLGISRTTLWRRLRSAR
ncbi:hypothetical protein NDR77_22740 [Pseudomonas aeruginosa]|nr:helix-turn-helix domain-containing protein [Pseudomonas aeruginosa]MCM5668793.1 hypothetical protein [Pseudomonas aeruginosa]MCU9036755.1 hypothetical protein [Pseudomonas aeruginosa]MCX2522566.1 hypothetical protein [Pseudomonas aeruginosa]MCZ9676878.1 hypothetical protein [Pseudomonas aeruginosa]MCZ9690552.1 hypothetical protein [Pseudomonas aeruginosa]